MQPSPQSENPAAPSPARPTGIGTALGRVPSGLFVVTWRHGDVDRGMLASWVMQAGFDPPMLSIAIAPGRDLLAAIEAGTPFAVNVLAESQRSLLARFGKPTVADDDPFAELKVQRGGGGVPLLGDAAAWLECVPVARITTAAEVRGDHVIVLARVTAGGTGCDLPPLVHLRKNGLRY